MKFVVSSGTLQKALSHIQGVVPSQTVYPILDHFYFEVKEGQLRATASDNHATMSVSIAVEASEDASFCVPAKILLDTLKSLPEQPITIGYNPEGHGLTLKSETGQYKLVGQAASEFPRLPQLPEGSVSLSLPAHVLARGIGNTLFAVGSDEMRLAMTGVYFKLENDRLSLVSTDAHKLVLYTKNGLEVGQTGSFIMPKKEVSLLRAALPNDAGAMVDIEFTPTNARFKFGDLTLFTRLIDQRYPDYNAVIPKENPNRLLIGRGDLVSALRRISIYSSKTTYQVRLKLTGSALTISAEDLDFSHNAQETLVADYAGEDMEIGFNARFLIDMLNTLDSEDALLEMSTPSRPGILTPGAIVDGETVLMLIMPVMLNSYEPA